MEWYERLNRVFAYVESSLYDIDYEKISQIALCPPGVLQRFFALNIGVTLTEYIRCRRLSEAALTLRHTDKKVIDIALDCGYDSHNAFGAAFKKFHAITPSEARKPGSNFKTYPRFLFEIKITQQEGATPMEKIQALTVQIEQEPASIILLLERMETYFELKEYRKAIADLIAANKLAPGDPTSPPLEYGYIERGIYEADLVQLSQASAKKAEAFHLHIRGCIDLMRARFVEAVEALTKAIALDPENSWLYHNRCISYFKQGKMQEALYDGNKAVELNPKIWNHYDKRGWCHFDTSKYTEAIVDYTTALKLNYKETSWLIPYLFMACDRLARYPKDVVRTLLELNEQNPADFELPVHIGHAAFHAKDFETAVSAYTTMAQKDLEEPRFIHYLHRGASYYFTGQYENAVADQTKVIELDPENPWHYIWRGKSYLKWEKLAEALQDFTTVIAMKTEIRARIRARGYELRSEVYRALGESENEFADLEKCNALKDESDIFWRDWH